MTLGTIVAYGQARRGEPDVVASWGVVHPAQRGRGIGSALFDRIEARVNELLAGVDSPRFRHALNARDAAAAQIVGAHGLRPFRHSWHMQIDLDGPIEPMQDPAGIVISGIEAPDELPVVHALLAAAFADDPADHPEPFDRWLHELLTNPSYDPSLWLLARDGDVPVGALTASSGDGGWVDWLGVLASYRGRGIGHALLGRAFAAFFERGMRRVMVNVDAENVTGATAVYERAGMRVVNAWDMWER